MDRMNRPPQQQTFSLRTTVAKSLGDVSGRRLRHLSIRLTREFLLAGVSATAPKTLHVFSYVTTIWSHRRLPHSRFCRVAGCDSFGAIGRSLARTGPRRSIGLW